MGELLGRVTAPSGAVVLIDFGLMEIWNGREGEHEDYLLVGPDAETAGAAFGHSAHPLYLYDRPESVAQEFKVFATERGYDVWLEPMGRRIAHRQRVQHTLDHFKGAGEVAAHGLTAVAVEVSRNQSYEVYGERMGGDEALTAGSWRSVSLVLQPDGVVAQTRPVGHVMVDRARLMFADVDALHAWDEQTLVDGRADVVFWGRDAAMVARELIADCVADGQYGWVSMPIVQAVMKAKELDAHKKGSERLFAYDFRPHTCHWSLMERVRGAETESGTIELAGAEVCGFMTSWGDGLFPVTRDDDAAGRPVALRVELGTDEAVARLRAVNSR